MGVPYAPNIREWPYLCNGWSDPLHVWFYGRVFGDGGSNGAIYGSNKSKMAAAAILEKIQMAISPQRLTIYLYSAHRAVIFAIAQLSCFLSRGYSLLLTNIFTVVNTFGILLKRIYADQNGTLHWQIYSVRPKTFHPVNGVRFSEIICKRTRIWSKILHAYYVLIISTTTSDKISFS